MGTNGFERDEVVRALPASADVINVSDEDGARPLLVGNLAVFDQWAEIDSALEGHFLERIAPGAFAKTIRENLPRIRALFHHGKDPNIGNKVLGPVVELAETDAGVQYKVDLLPTQYNEELRPGLIAGLYGTSFRARVVKAARNMRPARSAHNPDGIPEVTVHEFRLYEFGPTPLPVYEGTATAMRSMTDSFVAERLAERAARPAETHGDMADDLGISRSRYENILTFVAGSVWAMEPAALGVVLQIISERASGYRPSLDEIRERIGTVERAEPDSETGGPVRVIDISGPIIPRASLMSEISGAASLEALNDELRDAVQSEDVKSILLRIDSPGGSAFGLPEFAAALRAARDVKPVVASVDAMAASAAYYIASQASEVYVTPSGAVGSIGVYTAHEDTTGLQEKLGVKTTLVSAGEYKTEGNPFEPLTDEARAELQSKVDAFYGMFVGDVAKGRGTTRKVVEESYGRGRVVLANDAVEAGMADGVLAYTDVLSRLEKLATRVARSEPDAPSAAAATRISIEPEPSAATTRPAQTHVWGQDAPYWRI